MLDRDIVNLYFSRDSAAIDATAAQYGAYCSAIARRILGSDSDAEECVNDAFFKAWNAIPPQKPENLGTFLGKIVRNLAFDRLRYQHADKRGCHEMTLILDELAECLSGDDSAQQAIDRRELIDAINAFLRMQSEEKRRMFLCRYWYALPVSEIARRFDRSSNYISVTLNRLRGKLKVFLIEGGFDV
ncbi:MAG: sigma-70 family RNA polymerase sigma factor [Ruminococcaceae bacterium]|nr:sigma-70 family RNA polymerase sigma factor [Oscillospiraceae bacterium]